VREAALIKKLDQSTEGESPDGKRVPKAHNVFTASCTCRRFVRGKR
jgi:hypothetical protein